MKKISKKDEPRFDYNTYRLLLSVWMINEVSAVFQPVEMSNNGFYAQVVLYTLSVIFLGIPIVYSEICIVQFTNFDAVKMWNFCPLLKGAGYATLYLAVLKAILLNVLTSWYLIFAFHALMSPPPWYTCDEFQSHYCMVKRVNISIFQHCLESLSLFKQNCGMKTASSFFFDREIANNTTDSSKCFYVWKPIVATCITNLLLYVFCIKRHRLFVIISRGFVVIFAFVVFVLLVVSLLNDGTWFATKVVIHLDILENWSYYLNMLTRGILSCGAGLGIIGYLTRGVSFRSPATMTAISVASFGAISTLILSLILFNAIKTVSYYHGEENKVIEIGYSIFFNPFASVIENLSYFGMPLWTFLWFITLYLCLMINLWIMYMFLHDQIGPKFRFYRKRPSLCYWIFIIIIMLISYPFYCSDLTEVLAWAIEIIQLTNLLFFSIGLYWIYGYRNHITDIIFMIGIKSSIIWQVAWVLFPLILVFNLYVSFTSLDWDEFGETTFVLSARLDKIIFWILLSIYFSIFITTMCLQIRYYLINTSIRYLFSPSASWGPEDKVLFKSREMFVPDIMTREFLYRQVKIHGYRKHKSAYNTQSSEINLEETASDKTKWNALTSN